METIRQTVVVKGHRIRYQVAGHGEPVVLVHGLSGSARWWTRNLPALAEHYRVFVVDLPGFGAMSRPRQSFLLKGAASWLLAWMEATGLSRIHLVGHSMGGYISLRFAARNPGALNRLVLVDPAGVPTGRSLPQHFLSLLAALRYATPSFLPLLVHDALRTGPFTLWDATRDLLAEDVREELEQIVAPTLLVWGENDTLVPPSLGSLMREAISSSRLLIIQRAGHVPMYDRPQQFNRAVVAFLGGEAVGQ